MKRTGPVVAVLAMALGVAEPGAGRGPIVVDAFGRVIRGECARVRLAPPAMSLEREDTEGGGSPQSSGTFSFGPAETAHPGGWPDAVAIGDVTGDLRPDVVVATTSEGGEPGADERVLVYAMHLGGDLPAPRSYPFLASATGAALLVADLDEDGVEDVVVGHDEGLSVLLADGEGGLGGATLVAGGSVHALGTADLNGDGHTDVVAVGGTGGTSVYHGTGTGGLVATPPATASSALDGDVRDVTGDGLADLAIPVGTWIRVHAGDGTGLGATATELDAVEAIEAVGLGAVAGNDGLADVVAAEEGNVPVSLRVYPQAASGGFGPPALLATHHAPDGVGVRDLDGDGREDVVVLHAGWLRLGVFLQGAGGSLGSEALHPIPYASSYGPHGLATGDLDGDGCTDAAIAEYAHGLVVLRGEGCVDGLGASPGGARRGRNVEVAVTSWGYAFEPGAEASVSGTGVEVVRTVFESASRVYVEVNVEDGAALGARDLTIANPTGPPKTAPGAFRVLPAPERGPVVAHAPWFWVDDAYHALVEMRNVSGRPIEVTPVLWNDGPVSAGPRTIPPQGCDVLDARDVIVPPAQPWGGVEVGWYGLAGEIVANVSNYTEEWGTGFDAPFSHPAEIASETLHCPWFYVGEPSFDAVVEMRNASDYPIEVTAVVYTYDGSVHAYSPPPTTIPGRASRSLALGTYRPSLHADFGGVELASSGGAGSLVANVTSLSNAAGLSFDAACVDPSGDVSTRLTSPWFHVGEPVYKTVVEMKNASATRTLVVAPTLFGQKTDGTVVRVEPEPLELLPHMSTSFDARGHLAALDGATEGGIDLAHDGEPGDLVANATTLSFVTGLSFDAGFLDTAALAGEPQADSPHHRMAGGYAGYMQIHNTTERTIRVRTLATSASGDAVSVLDPIAPRGTKLLVLDDPADTGGCSRVSVTGNPGDALANVTTIGATVGVSFDAAAVPRR